MKEIGVKGSCPAFLMAVPCWERCPRCWEATASCRVRSRKLCGENPRRSLELNEGDRGQGLVSRFPNGSTVLGTLPALLGSNRLLSSSFEKALRRKSSKELGIE